MDLELRALLIEQMHFDFEIQKGKGVRPLDQRFNASVQIDFHNGEVYLYKFESEFLHEATDRENHFKEYHQIKSDVKKWAIDKLFN